MSEQRLTAFTPDYRGREVCPPHLWTIGSDHRVCASCEHWVVSECHVSIDQLHFDVVKRPDA